MSLLRFCFLLMIFCAFGVGHGFLPRRKLGNPHIMGGEELDIREIPYMASIRQFSVGFHCGASIIGKYYVLTAAHCLKGRRPARYGVGAGVFTRDISSEARYTIRSIVVHPEFDDIILDYDVAVVRILDGFNFNQKIAPIVLVEQGHTLNPSNWLVVSGWGRTSQYDPEGSDKLLKTELQYIDQSDCKKLYDRRSRLLTDRMFCAGVAEGGYDAGKGDSGGPIVDLKSGKQVGIVSWGSGMGNPMTPGVYTKLSNPEIWQFVIERTKE